MLATIARLGRFVPRQIIERPLASSLLPRRKKIEIPDEAKTEMILLRNIIRRKGSIARKVVYVRALSAHLGR